MFYIILQDAIQGSFKFTQQIANSEQDKISFVRNALKHILHLCIM